MSNKVFSRRSAMTVFLLLFCGTLALAQSSKPAGTKKAQTDKKVAETKEPSKAKPSSDNTRKSEHIMTRPGEITFTQGAVIVGKVEKPQVMIVFPKEKPKADSIVFDRSFKDDMIAPLDIKVISDMAGK